ncbi:PEP-CTERM motif protein [Burkholderiales bacterium JOSHI_001]|nr:PEP-CTERM motif protein [Burkholderiales bacterium JOSHI_001]
MRTTAIVSASLLAISQCLPAHAQQNVDMISGPMDFTAWTLFGSASAQNLTPGNGFTYSLLHLTQPFSGDQAGAAFAPTALALDFNQAFQFDWVWSVPAVEGLRGDGYTFTLSSTPSLGLGGSSLGYEGGAFGASVAFAVDTFHFDGEPVSPSVQILADGNITPLAATETGLGDAIRDTNYAWFGRLRYTPSGLDDHTGTLTGRIEHLNLGSFEVQAGVDFGALGLAGQPVFYGFTAANGAATDGHTIQWGAAVPVPEPGSWVLMLAGLALVPLIKRL